jgi:hypothetical protein
MAPPQTIFEAVLDADEVAGLAIEDEEEAYELDAFKLSEILLLAEGTKEPASDDKLDAESGITERADFMLLDAFSTSLALPCDIPMIEPDA